MNLERPIEEKTSETRERIRELALFDANLWIGKPLFFPLADELPAGEIEPLMTEFHLQNALLSHWDSVRLSAQDGNQALLTVSKGLPSNVHTVWTGLPTLPREQGPLPGLGPPDPRMRGVRLFPETHRYQPVPRVVGGLCEWCAKRNLPLFIWHVEARWDDVHALASAFPALTFVIETQWQKILYRIRDLFSLLKVCPNVLVESSNFIGQDHVTQLVRTFGAERLVFGSFLPVNDPYSAIGMILDADISGDEKALVAGGNLRRLVGRVRT